MCWCLNVWIDYCLNAFRQWLIHMHLSTAGTHYDTIQYNSTLHTTAFTNIKHITGLNETGSPKFWHPIVPRESYIFDVFYELITLSKYIYSHCRATKMDWNYSVGCQESPLGNADNNIATHARIVKRIRYGIVKGSFWSLLLASIVLRIPIMKVLQCWSVSCMHVSNQCYVDKQPLHNRCPSRDLLALLKLSIDEFFCVNIRGRQIIPLPN